MLPPRSEPSAAAHPKYEECGCEPGYAHVCHQAPASAAAQITALDVERREAVARIIDPEHWRAWDLGVSRALLAGDTEATRWADFAFGGRCVESLRKADVILAFLAALKVEGE